MLQCNALIFFFLHDYLFNIALIFFTHAQRKQPILLEIQPINAMSSSDLTYITLIEKPMAETALIIRM